MITLINYHVFKEQLNWREKSILINCGVVKRNDTAWWNNNGEPIEVRIDWIDHSKGKKCVFVNEIQGDEKTRTSLWVSPADLYINVEDIMG